MASVSDKQRRNALIDLLGGKCSCSGVDCWHTGSCQVSDPRCLQLDHIHSDGALDRRKHKASGFVRYYADNMGEAKEHLQVLCANCNWVKRVTNNEIHRGRRGLTLVSIKIVSLPEYGLLMDDAKSLCSDAVRYGEPDFVANIENHGFAPFRRDAARCLCVEWEKCKSVYDDSVAGLSGFLGERRIILNMLRRQLDARRTGVIKGGNDE